ncbi:dTDP-4-dehydrorhamnose 3,5-epimerase family protein [Mycobacterium sp. BMJ-28]
MTEKMQHVTVEWLSKQNYEVQPLNSPTIEGVAFRPLKTILDGRGDVIELWSEPWEGFTSPTHVYQSATDYGVVKCWHLHEVHTDQFTVTRGKIQVTLVDVRKSSGSFGQVNLFIMGEAYPGLLRIPPGLLHGWKCLSIPEVIVTNLQSHIYDPSDEYKFPWDCVLKDVWQPKNG